MLTFRIHYALPDGSEDCVIVKGEDIAEVRKKARAAVESRLGTPLWSEQVD